MENSFKANTHKSNTKFALITTFLYTIAIIIVSCFHEVWRDEVALLSVVRESKSFSDFIATIQNFGHPPLYHFLIHTLYSIVPHVLILKIANIAISSTAILLLLLKSPFSRLQNVFLMLGVLPFYVYPIINRSYGLSFLLIIILCILYKNRFTHIIRFSIVLALLICTHAQSMLLGICLGLSLLIELIFLRDNIREQKPNIFKVLIGIAIVIGALATFKFFTTPNPDSIIFRPDSYTIESIRRAFILAVIFPGKAFLKLFPVENTFFLNTIIFGVAIHLLRRINLFILFSAAVVMLNMLFFLVYPSHALRHQGYLFLLIFFVLWINTYPGQEYTFRLKPLQKLRTCVSSQVSVFFTMLLFIHMSVGISTAIQEIQKPYSSAKSLSQHLQRLPYLNNAIIMSEPDDYLETLPYYLDNDLYMYRENAFQKVISLTTKAKMHTQLEDLLIKARELQASEKKDIVILLSENIQLEGPYIVPMAYERSFTYSRESLESFLNQTQKIGTFEGSITDENYSAYILKPIENEFVMHFDL